MTLKCRKCGSTDPPAAKFTKQFSEGCKYGSCPDGEHLHLTCECGFSGIGPCADAKELGPPLERPQELETT